MGLNSGWAQRIMDERGVTVRQMAAAAVKASISCMSSEMLPSFSGCHWTPTTHQPGSISPLARRKRADVGAAWWLLCRPSPAVRNASH